MKDLKLNGDFNKMYKKFGGEYINDTIGYLESLLDENPNLTIAVGCDSKRVRRRTLFANTIMIYDYNFPHGAHVIFNRFSTPRIHDTYTRLSKEAEYVLEIGSWLDENLNLERNDLMNNEILHKLYKYNIGIETGRYRYFDSPVDERNFINSMQLTEFEKNKKYRSVDLHLDFSTNEGRMGKNRSYQNYRAVAPWLRGMDYRVFFKPNAIGATSAADLLLK